MEAFIEPMSQLIIDLSAFNSEKNSTVDSDRTNVLAAFRLFVDAVETFAEHLHRQLHRDKTAFTSTGKEVTATINDHKNNLLQRSKHMLEIADDAVTNTQQLKRLALDLQLRASKIREAIEGLRVQSIQRSKVDEARITQIEEELEKQLALVKETDAKLQDLERDMGNAEDTQTTMSMVRFASLFLRQTVPVVGIPLRIYSDIYGSSADEARSAQREVDALKVQKESVLREARDLGASMNSLKAQCLQNASNIARCEGQLKDAGHILNDLHKSEIEAIDLVHLDALKQTASRFVSYATDLEGDVCKVHWAEASLELQTNVRSLVEGMRKVEDLDFALALRRLE